MAAEVGRSDTVFVATGVTFPDALAGSAWAGSLDAPLLLVKRGQVPPATRTQLDRLSPERIVVLGGTATISNSVVTQLDSYGRVERIGGAKRWETAAAVAAQFPDAEPVVVASGQNWPDALVGSARAGRLGSPVILVRTDRIPDASRFELIRLGPLSVEVYGGKSAVSPGVVDDLESLYD